MSRADRNNNPGNLRPGVGKVYWQGQTGTDPDGFAVFGSKDDGLSAAQHQVMVDYNKHGLKTPTQLAQKYTKTDQAVYAQRLAGALGVGLNEDTKLNDPAKFAAYMGQIYTNEDGPKSVGNPDDEFDKLASAHDAATNPDGAFDGVASLNPQAAPQAAQDAPQGAPEADPFTKAMGGAPAVTKQPDGTETATYEQQDPNGLTGEVTDKSPDLVPTFGGGLQGKLAAGVVQGLRDVNGTISNGADWLTTHVPVLGAIDKAGKDYLGVPTAQDSVASDTAARTAYENQYGHSAVAGMGRIGGNLAVSLPLMAAGDEAAGAALPNALAPVGNFLAGATRGNMLVRGASMAARGGIQGGELGALTSGGNDRSLASNVVSGAETGAVANPLLGAVGGAANKMLGMGGAVDPARAALAGLAREKGIDVRGSQITSSPFVRTLDNMLSRIPGTGMDASNGLQRGQFTRAITNTFGEDSHALTPDVMQTAKTNIGGRIGEIAGRNTISDTEGLVNDLADIEHNASGVLENAAPVHQQISNILNKIGPDATLSGSDYQTLIRKGGPLAALQESGDPAKVNIANNLRDALDDAFEKSVSLEDLQAFRAARLQYKNLMTVKGLAAKSPDGTVSPALLNQAVTTSFKDRAFSGAGELGDLGKIGQMFLKPGPSSGTAENSKALELMLGAGRLGIAGAGGFVGLHMGAPAAEALGGAAAAGIATPMIGRVVSKAMRSPAYANKLIAAANDPASITDGVLARYGAPAITVENNRLLSKSGARR